MKSKNIKISELPEEVTEDGLKIFFILILQMI